MPTPMPPWPSPTPLSPRSHSPASLTPSPGPPSSGSSASSEPASPFALPPCVPSPVSAIGGPVPLEHPRLPSVYPVPRHQEARYALLTDPETTTAMAKIAVKHYPAPDFVGVGVAHVKAQCCRTAFLLSLNTRFRQILQGPDPPFLRAGVVFEQSVGDVTLATLQVWAAYWVRPVGVPPPPNKPRPCPSYSRRRDRNDCVCNLITYEM